MRVLSRAKPLPLPEKVELFHSLAHASHKKRPAGAGFHHSATPGYAAVKVSALQENIPALLTARANNRRWRYRNWRYAVKRWERDAAACHNLPRPFRAIPASPARNLAGAPARLHARSF